jgi:hypothetical protein
MKDFEVVRTMSRQVVDGCNDELHHVGVKGEKSLSRICSARI